MYVAPREPGGERRHLSHLCLARRRHGARHPSRGGHADLAGAPGYLARPRLQAVAGADKQPDPDPFTAVERKSLNDAVAYIRSLAELRGRNADWAEKAVRDAATLTATAALEERVIDVVAKDVPTCWRRSTAAR